MAGDTTDKVKEEREDGKRKKRKKEEDTLAVKRLEGE